MIIKKLFKSTVIARFLNLGLVILFVAYTIAPTVGVSALSKDQQQLLQSGVRYFNTGIDTSCGTANAPSTVAGNKLFYIGDSLTYHMVRGSEDDSKYNDFSGKLLEQSKSPGGYDVDTTIPPVGGTDSTKDAPRIIGKSVEAQGGVNVANTIPHLAEHTQDYASADIIVIGLGTNTEQLDFATEIDALINTIRANNTHAVIYWVNTYYIVPGKKTYQEKNAVIDAQHVKDNYTVIDYASEAAKNPLIAPEPYQYDNVAKKVIQDGIHVETGAGRQAKAAWIISQLPKPTAAPAPTADTTASGYEPTSLTYPAFPDEAATETGIENTVRHFAPSSPWLDIPNLGHFMLVQAKQYNVNPLFVMSTGGVESTFGTKGAGVPNHNAFGWDKGDKQFPSWADGITAFAAYIREALDGKGGHDASYTKAKTIYEYSSVHQTGGIYYPGNNKEIYGDGPDFPIHDDKMNVDVSWESPYNPLAYYKLNITFINYATGLSLPADNPPQPGQTAGGVTCNSTPATGAASQYIPDCSVNGGNAAIACTAINQLSNIAYPNTDNGQFTDGATVANPTLLDCSGLTNMAIYRTFGVKLQLCSVMYKTNSNFEEIDVHEIQPGDLVGIGAACHSVKDGTGHIAIVVSYDATNKKLITMEASSTKWLSGVRGTGSVNTFNVGLKADGNGNFEWAVRYIGPKNLQPGANQ